jgi:dephospho-CoA kinase
LTRAVLMVGLTGGIGSGKSAVSTRLATLGAVIVDSDRIAREVVAPGTEGLREIVATFGVGVLHEDGSLNRPALAEVVFGDDQARRRLEAITHPRVRARSAQLAAVAGSAAVVVNDVPLLVEVGLAPTYHLVIVVEAAQAVRVERLVRDRGMTAEQAYQRIRSQTGDPQRRAAADVVLANDGDLADLYAAVDTLWHDRLLPYERNVRERRAVDASSAAPVDADSTWPARAARLAARIRHVVGPEPRIDQVDPTTMPEPPVRNVIEIRVVVDSLVKADALAGPLADAGFPRYPDAGRGPGERPTSGEPRKVVGQPGGDRPVLERLHGSADPGRPVNLHVQVGG